MDRVFESGALGSAPAAPASPSTGYPTNGNPSTGTPATLPGAFWYGMLTEEIRQVITDAGLTPDHTDWTQLSAAISALIAAQQQPVGSLIWVPGNAAPSNYLKANGSLLSRTTYAALWTYAQASGNLAASDGAWVAGKFSPGDGSTTFRIPDLRGEFVRGWDDGRGVDSGRTIGSHQTDELKSHTHTLPDSMAALGAGGSWNGTTPAAKAAYAATNATGGSETRPRNVAALACIRYQ